MNCWTEVEVNDFESSYHIIIGQSFKDIFDQFFNYEANCRSFWGPITS